MNCWMRRHCGSTAAFQSRVGQLEPDERRRVVPVSDQRDELALQAAADRSAAERTDLSLVPHPHGRSQLLRGRPPPADRQSWKTRGSQRQLFLAPLASLLSARRKTRVPGATGSSTGNGTFGRGAGRAGNRHLSRRRRLLSHELLQEKHRCAGHRRRRLPAALRSSLPEAASGRCTRATSSSARRNMGRTRSMTTASLIGDGACEPLRKSSIF